MRTVFSAALMAAAQADPRVLLLTGDHGYALFDGFRARLPKQYINAGVAEQNMVSVAAGLAKVGFKPVVYGLSSFVPIRVLEQIKLDICYENLGVTLVGDGAGLVYSSLGSSHQSTEDIACLRAIANIGILSPCDGVEMQYVMRSALAFAGPCYLRIGKSDAAQVYSDYPDVALGDLVLARNGTGKHGIAFIATGSMVSTAMQLAQEQGDAKVWSVPCIKPINQAQVSAIAADHHTIVVVEEHATAGGLGGQIAEIVSETAVTKVVRFGIDDRFSEHCGSYAYLLREHGLDLASLRMKLKTSVIKTSIKMAADKQKNVVND